MLTAMLRNRFLPSVAVSEEDKGGLDRALERFRDVGDVGDVRVMCSCGRGHLSLANHASATTA
jgi:hypothetical protein